MRRLNHFAVVLMLACGLTSCYSKLFTPERVYKKEKNQLRVVTYNINWGESNFPITAPQKTANAIRLLDGDIVLLQEATPFWQSYFKDQLTDLYPYQLFKKQDNGGGFAVLAKYPVADQVYTHSAMGWHPGWIIDVNSPYGALQVANLHLTPPLTSKSHLNFDLGVYFSSPVTREQEICYYYQFIKPNRPTIIAGDFNEDDNGFVTQYLEQHGFTDAHFKNGKKEYTWSWKLGLITVYKKLDHIFYDHSFRETRAQVYHEGDSDHYPLAVDLIKG